MSYLVGDHCYPTLASAASAYGARFQPSGLEISPGCIAIPVLQSAAVEGQLSLSYVRIAGTCTPPGAVTIAPAFPACPKFGVSDAVEMGWLVGAAWVAAFCVAVLLRRALA